VSKALRMAKRKPPWWSAGRIEPRMAKLLKERTYVYLEVIKFKMDAF
jgi:hypothetical protein